MINGTSDSGIKKSINISITIYTMLFSIDGFPRTISLIRSDESTATVSVEFDQGALETVSLSGEWIGDSPNGVTVSYSISSSTPPYDSILTITTSKSAEAGNFVYRVTGTASGLTKTVNFYVNIMTGLSVTAETDKNTYDKGQKIKISGIVRDENDDLVSSGTATISFSTKNWEYSFTTSISSGSFSTNYYITFDKPEGNWVISVSATDTRGHITSSSTNLSIKVLTPDNYNHYSIEVISPLSGQLYKRGETVTFTVSLSLDTEKIIGADVKAFTTSGEEIILTETSPGLYTTTYNLGYDSPLGNWSLYVEGTKIEEEKLKAGFNFVDFEVQSIKPVIEIVEPKTRTIEVGDTIEIIVKINYPDGSPVDEGVVTALSKDGNTLLFTKSRLDLYSVSYTPNTDSLGDWEIELKVEDAYGNSAVLTGEKIEIIQTSVTSLLVRFWWATLISLIVLISAGIYFARGKLRQLKLHNLKLEAQEFEKLKKEKAIQYFVKGEITRQTYDQLFKDYESKIASLTKKTRLLEKKMAEAKHFTKQKKK
jgi:hypothetical protein